jgi:hypothetical protein
VRYFPYAVCMLGAAVLAQAAAAADIDTRVIRQAARVAPQEPLPRDERLQPARLSGDPLLVRMPLNLIDTGFAGVPFATGDALSKALSAETPVLAR